MDIIHLSDDKIRVMCAVICDGSFFGIVKNKNRCRINIKKKRKKDRLRALLNNARIPYEEHNWNPNDKEYTSFVFDAPIATKEFDSYWYNCSNSQLMIITDEVLHWDGSVTEKRKNFSTCITGCVASESIKIHWGAVCIAQSLVFFCLCLPLAFVLM